MKEKVILYGISDEFEVENVFLSMKPCYEILGVSDKNAEMGRRVAEKLNIAYYKPEELENISFDIIYVTTKAKDTYAGVLSEMVWNRKIAREKVLYYTDFYREKAFSFGEKNPDKTIYVLRRAYAKNGVFAFLMHLLPSMLELPDNVEVFVDLKNYRTVYHKDGEVGKKNVWEYWFEQPCGMSAEEVYSSKNVILGPTDEWSAWLKDNDSLLEIYRTLFRKISPNQKFQNLLVNERNKVFGEGKRKEKVCAVVYRGTDYLKLKTYSHPIQPDLDTLLQKVKELQADWGFQKIYLVTEDAEGLKRFQKEFGENVYMSERELMGDYPVVAADASAILNIRFQREDDEYLKGMEYLRQIYIAAECDYIISGLNSGYRGAMYLSKGFEKKYVFDLGIYGIDDDSYATPWGHYILIEEEKRLKEKREKRN